MYVIGHRGCMDQYPENTIRAVREAAPHVDAVEVDVQRCGSGELVAIHDETLERITEADGVVAETPWSVLSDLEVHGSGEPITQFAAMVDSWPAGLDMNLDVHTTGVVRDALALLTEFDGNILLSSTNPTVLEEATRSDVTVTRGYSFYEDIDASIERAVAMDCDFVHVHAGVCLGTDVIRRAHDASLKVDAWTVVDADTYRRIETAGVDAVTVDRWDIVDGR